MLGHGLNMLTLNRPPGRTGISHGGVAIIARNATTKLEPFPFPNPELFEVLVGKISVHQIKRKFLVIGAYIPPNYPVGRGRACISHINDIILEIKRKVDDPYILLAGDFNQWTAPDAVADYPDIAEILTPPTRQERRIDRIFCNWQEDVHEAGCIPPLQTEELDIDGRRCYSDHAIQYALSRLPLKEQVKWEEYSYRPFTDAGAAAFETELNLHTWEDVLTSCDSSTKAIKLQLVLDDLMDKHFPLKTVLSCLVLFEQ